MRTNAPKGSFTESSLITLKDQEWLDNQRVAGRVAASALLLLENEVKQGTTKSLLELDKLAETYIRDNGCQPTFLFYKGFPNSVCISVNKQLVHGVPTDYILKDADLVSFDLGTTFEGAIADTAITCIFGKPYSDKCVQLVKDTEEALMRGIRAIQVGKRLGVIGQAIHKYAGKNYGLINNYGGHGLDWNVPHAPPFVENKSEANKGIRIESGLVIAIEPMLTLGSTVTTTASDGWTVVTPDLSAHFEHSIFVHEDRVEIITDRSKL